MGEPVWTRAALLRGQADPDREFRHVGFGMTVEGKDRRPVGLKVLPEGRRAAEYGRSILDRGTDGFWSVALPMAQRTAVDVPNWVGVLIWWSGRERLDGRVPIPILDMPVWVNPADGSIIEVHAETLVQELQPWRDEAVYLFKRTDSPLSDVRAAAGAPKQIFKFGGSVLKEWKDAARQLREELKSDARPPGERPAGEVEGVDYETWVRCKALLARDMEVHPQEVDYFTHFRGVPWGRWTAIDASWSAHAPPEWVRYDVNRFRPTGASWELGY